MSETHSTNQCSIDECGLRIFKRGFCYRHYHRDYAKKSNSTCPLCGTAFWRAPSEIVKGKVKVCSRKCRAKWLEVDFADSFFSRVGKKQANGCIIWAGCKGKGYGLIGRMKNSTQVRAHRAAYELCVQKIPEGMHVLHDCPGGDNPSCINPSHLWIGTHQDNMADRDRKERGAKGERIGLAKLSKEKAKEILELLSSGIAQRKIAKKFGVDRSQISRIKTGERWT